MNNLKQAKSALISVFSKDGLEPIVKKLDEQGVTCLLYTSDAADE